MTVSWFLLLIAACGPSRNPAREAIDAERAQQPSRAGWTCPMHPEVHADEAGPCPVCGMALVHVEG